MTHRRPAHVRSEAVRRVGAGETVYRVAAELGVARSTVSRWVRAAGAESSLPEPASLAGARERAGEPLGEGESFWQGWEARSRERAAAEPDPPAPPASAASTCHVSDRASRLVQRLGALPWVLIGLGGAAVARGIRGR